jgi:hypothetical protein
MMDEKEEPMYPVVEIGLVLLDEYVARARVEFDMAGVELDEASFMGWLVGRLATLEGKL